MTTMRISLVIGATAGLLLSTACTSTQPTPTSTPAKPAFTVTSPAPAKAEAPSAKPTQASAATPAVKADWKEDWDKTLAAAKMEGKVVVNGSPGDPYRLAAMNFQKAYPEIQLEYSGTNGSVIAPRMIAERESGLYVWDVVVAGANTGLDVYRPRGMLDPVKPLLTLPDVVDDSKWLSGLEGAWVDREGKYLFGFSATLFPTLWVNRDMVPEAELNSMDQLMDPKWKGKIVSADLRAAGAQTVAVAWILKHKGEDWLRKFFAQDIVIVKDERAVVEGVVRGRYPVMVGINQSIIQQITREVQTKSLKPLEPEGEAGIGLSTGSNHVMFINKAPHPNAAKVFINWILTREGQEAYVQATNVPSRRVDVAGGDEDFKPKPNVKYGVTSHEDNVPFNKRVTEIAKEMFQ